MKRWGVISTVGGSIGAILILAASVPLDEATGNLASWLKPLGQEPAKSILFWIGVGVIVIALILPIPALLARIDKRIGQTIPADTTPADHWAHRKRLEISVIANVSAGREPNARPIVGEPENSRLRELKDAIADGEIDAELNGRRANVRSTVTLHDFTIYVAATNKPHWVELLHRWQKVQTPAPDEPSDELKEKRIPLLKFLEIARNQTCSGCVHSFFRALLIFSRSSFSVIRFFSMIQCLRAYYFMIKAILL